MKAKQTASFWSWVREVDDARAMRDAVKFLSEDAGDVAEFAYDRNDNSEQISEVM